MFPSRDTKPAAQRALLERLRAASDGRRAAMATSLSEHVILASRRVLAEARPGLTAREVNELWARYHYGPAAERLLALPRPGLRPAP